ncbi:FAD-dependent oxidoreductase [Roseomonas sp. NAR14]|uniref:FAD-dependent oxidoreductase n=2 Tax=Roseomonas acroporae TaxID=2937791 RepID=A0A9X2BY41_9PROT|nr:FAD-dependent oxidoreductase [Roseomonas acroporae]MCK8787976.1 FAD-dependent oxidoreductase [Roseomonas acroporae]
MSRTVHVVGAGLAGLAAALRLSRGGRRVVVHEASPQAGGRCRALPDGTDNGTHALLGANRAALRFLGEVGARDGWIEPEPDGLPVLDLASGEARRVGLSPRQWLRQPALRPPGLGLGGMGALLRLAGGGDRAVGPAMAAHPALLRHLVDPLVIAALNTPVEEAGARWLAPVLRRLGRPGATRLFVAREGLGPDLIAPTLTTLALAGVELRHGARLRRLEQADGRATALDFGEDRIVVSPSDRVVLALPPWEAKRLLPALPAPERFAPILNLHYARVAAGPVRFLGLLDALAQWVLVRPTGVSVTVSAADAAMDAPQEALMARAWAELRRAALAFGLPGPWPEAAPACRVVKERRATPRHGTGPAPAPPRLPLANLALAGDWTLPALPATIEGTIRSGEAAAAALR